MHFPLKKDELLRNRGVGFPMEHLYMIVYIYIVFRLSKKAMESSAVDESDELWTQNTRPQNRRRSAVGGKQVKYLVHCFIQYQ